MQMQQMQQHGTSNSKAAHKTRVEHPISSTITCLRAAAALDHPRTQCRSCTPFTSATIGSVAERYDSQLLHCSMMSNHALGQPGQIGAVVSKHECTAIHTTN